MFCDPHSVAQPVISERGTKIPHPTVSFTPIDPNQDMDFLPQNKVTVRL